jgi:hypothetical protein
MPSVQCSHRNIFVESYVRFEVSTAVTMKNVRTDVPEKHIASIIKVAKIGELGTSLAITSNRNKL